VLSSHRCKVVSVESSASTCNLVLSNDICGFLRVLSFMTGNMMSSVILLTIATIVINKSNFSSRSPTSEILHFTWFSTFATAKIASSASTRSSAYLVIQ
jgi:hypothetical protein